MLKLPVSLGPTKCVNLPCSLSYSAQKKIPFLILENVKVLRHEYQVFSFTVSKANGGKVLWLISIVQHEIFRRADQLTTLNISWGFHNLDFYASLKNGYI